MSNECQSPKSQFWFSVADDGLGISPFGFDLAFGFCYLALYSKTCPELMKERN
jgi:hypothetical protein